MIRILRVSSRSNLQMRTTSSGTCLIAVCLLLEGMTRRRRIWKIKGLELRPDSMKSELAFLRANSKSCVTLPILLDRQPVICSWVRTLIHIPTPLRRIKGLTTSYQPWAIRYALGCPGSCLTLLDLPQSEVLLREPGIRHLIRRQLQECSGTTKL